MIHGVEAWLLLGWGFFVPGVAIACFIWYNIKYRRRK